MERNYPKYIEWVESEYAKIIELEKLSDYADQHQLSWLKTMVQKFSFRFSSIWRQETLAMMKYYVIPKRTDYAVTIFKIQRKGASSYKPDRDKDFLAIYALLYTSVTNKDMTHEFVTACPTFTSADGEYRHRFISLEQYLHNYRNAAPEMFQPVEEHLLGQINRKEVTLFSETIFPPHMERWQGKLLEFIDKSRLAIALYCSTWCIDYTRYELGLLENHITQNYTLAMFSKYDRKFYSVQQGEIRKTMGDAKKSNTGEAVLRRLQRFDKDPTQIVSPVEIGQKIIPLSIKQVENLGDIRFSTWLEVQISIYATDLVINGISPTFPMFCNWFLIRNADTSLYDNSVMHFKLHNSELAVGVVRDLEQARKNTYLLDPLKKKEIFLSYNMEGLSKAIEIPMDYAEEEMIISSNALCILSEYVSRTMADQPRLIQIPELVGITRDFLHQPEWYHKYWFEYLYGLYMLNSKLGVIHGDLHLNNITLFCARAVYSIQGNHRVPNPTIIYNVHGEIYAFPTTGRTSCIIDFSRCILSNDSPIFQGYDNYGAITADQRHKILRLYERELPEFYKAYHKELKDTLLHKFSCAFKMFTAIDVRKLCGGLLTILPKGPLAEKTENMRKLAEQYVTVGMIRIFKEECPDPSQYTWPILEMIQKFFTEYTLDKFPHKDSDAVTLVDYFSADNSLRYSSKDYDHYPPIVKLDYIIKHKIPIEQMGIRNFYREQKEAPKEEERLLEVQREEIASKAERRGTPALDEQLPKSKSGLKELQKEISLSSEFYYDS
jgi:hypothetical protein